MTFSQAATLGSPPRARGKANDRLFVYLATGITPACAGKRGPHTGSMPGAQDHPRVRGEKEGTTDLYTKQEGSPPRARGKGDGDGAKALCLRITPACAGKSTLRRVCQSAPWDHPRVREEKYSSSPITASNSGSPPRARGKALSSVSLLDADGITPACAGKSSTDMINNRLD